MKSIAYLSFGLLIACLMWSCERNELHIEPANLLNSSASLRSETSINHNAGILHNRGLDSMYANCTPVIWTPQNIVSCSEIVAAQLGFDTLHINDSDSMEIWLNQLYTSVDLDDFIINIVEQSLIMLDSSGINTLGILDTFIDMVANDTYDFETLYDISVNSSFTGPTREGVEAFLGILSYSSIYWEEDPDVTDHGIIQLDAVGGLICWGYAVYDEIRENGQLSVENSGKRIDKCIQGAIAFSLGGRKWKY